MEVIDEDGDLFGVVNVVDALVVLLVLAVIVAGIALLNPFASSGEEATRYVTIDLGAQPDVVAEQIDEGDVMSPRRTSKNVTVTDVHVTPASGNSVSVTVRVEANGSLVENEQVQGESFEFGNQQIQQGQRFNVTTADYEANGTVLDVSENRETLDVETSEVTATATVSTETAQSISVGHTYEIANSTVAEITDLHVAPGTGANTSRVVVGMELQSLNRTRPTFANGPITLGRSIPFEEDEYAFSGEITRIGTSTVETDTAQVTLQTTLDVDTAQLLSSGDTYRLGGEPVGTITDVRLFPSPEADQRTALVAVELSTVVRPDGQYFGGSRIAIGAGIPFQTENYQFSGQIQDLETPTIETQETQTVIETTTSADVAESIEVGDEYRLAGETIGTIQDVVVYPTGDDDQRRVVLGLSLQTLLQNGNQRFGTLAVRIGNTIPFETDEYELQGQIQDRGTTIETESSQAVVEATTSAEAAASIEVGDEYRLADNTIGTIETLRVYPTGDAGTKRVVVGLELRTLPRDGNLRFGTIPVQVDATIPFETDEYEFSGTVIDRGSLSLPGETTTRTVVVKLENVPPEFADGITPGLRERQNGETRALVTSVQVEPAVITLDGDDGDVFRQEDPDIYRTEHPVNKDVYVTIQVTARETDDGLQFHRRQLSEGSGITLDFDSITVQGTVIDIGSGTNQTVVRRTQQAHSPRICTTHR